jgi:hypothetical protein
MAKQELVLTTPWLAAALASRRAQPMGVRRHRQHQCCVAGWAGTSLPFPRLWRILRAIQTWSIPSAGYLRGFRDF